MQLKITSQSWIQIFKKYLKQSLHNHHYSPTNEILIPVGKADHSSTYEDYIECQIDNYFMVLRDLSKNINSYRFREYKLETCYINSKDYLTLEF